jgi:hypothetical protein
MSDNLRAAALAALEWLRDERLDTWTYMDRLFYKDCAKHTKALEAALAEPEQEPMPPEIIKMYEDYFDKCYRDSSAQQRPWVGLTEDEITKLHHEIKAQLMGTYKTEDIYRAIETKLREKNT